MSIYYHRASELPSDAAPCKQARSAQPPNKNDRAMYLSEFGSVGGILAYKVPETRTFRTGSPSQHV